MQIKDTVFHLRRFPYTFLARNVCIPGGIIVLVLLDIKTHDFGTALQGQNAQTTAGLSLLAFYLIYMVLLLLRTRWSPWPRWQLIYIYVLAIFSLTLVTGMFVSPLLRLVGYVSIGVVVIQARNAFGKVGIGLVGCMLALTISLNIFLPSNDITLPISSLPVGLWLLGLVLLQTFTVLGMHERTVRIRNEQLVRLLMVTQQQLRSSAARAEELAVVRERMRAAREMHDTLAQGLAAIKMHLETSTSVFDPQPALASHHLEQARLLAGEYLSKTRRSIAALRTDSPQGQSLPQALAHLTTIWQECGMAVHIHMSSQVDQESIPIFLAQTYTRIAEEALNNAHTHGRARHVEIELSLEAEQLCLAITDDGIGFEPASLDTYTQSGHFGIIGMYERAHIVEGHLDLVSASGMGTQVMIVAPLHRSQQGVSNQ